MESNASFSHMLGATAESMAELDVVILYEDFASGVGAKNVLCQALHRPQASCHYRLSMWKFNLLRIRALKSQAVQDIAGAAIVCISAHEAGGVPPDVMTLVTDCLRGPKVHPAALVVLLEGGERADASSTPGVSLLRRVAGQCGVEFFLRETEPLKSIEGLELTSGADHASCFAA